MKKLKLKTLNLEGAEILSREQLKKIMGGGMMGISSGGETTEPTGTNAICTCNDGYAPGMSADNCKEHCNAGDICADHGGGGTCS